MKKTKRGPFFMKHPVFPLCCCTVATNLFSSTIYNHLFVYNVDHLLHNGKCITPDYNLYLPYSVFHCHCAIATAFYLIIILCCLCANSDIIRCGVDVLAISFIGPVGDSCLSL